MSTWPEEEAKLRARWDELTEKRRSIMAVVEPLRDGRDKFSREVDAKLKAMDASIKAQSEGLFEIDNEMGSIARKLGARSIRVR